MVEYKEHRKSSAFGSKSWVLKPNDTNKGQEFHICNVLFFHL